MSVFVKMNRFGEINEKEIDENIKKTAPQNTLKSKNSIWRQFMSFCDAKKYTFGPDTSVTELASILKSWAFNMRKKNGEEYKEHTVKVLWNVTAKLLMEKYFNDYKIKINPFEQIEFKAARDARNAKRRNLQGIDGKRKESAAFLTHNELKKLIEASDELTPEGLQKKVFFLLSYELAWRGGEGARAETTFFKEETDNIGAKTGRIEYNPIFSKTTQGGARKLADSKWLVKNETDHSFCPVRMFLKLQDKRGKVTNTRLFLTPNPHWKISGNWFKNSPVGINEISAWTKIQAKKSGLNTTKKITNHSLRATAVSKLAKSGVSEQNLIKITGHSNAKSISSYLQMDEDHHRKLIQKMREHGTEVTRQQIPPPMASSSHPMAMSSENQNVVNNYQNCNFYYSFNNS